MSLQKPLKVQTLRNMEYYDSMDLFDELYAKSLNNKTFTSLMPLIMNERNIKLAYRSYKCALKGIYVDFVDESYTSKSSFLDKDIIPTYNKNNKTKYVFSGVRTKRGLYVSGNGTKINADVNGSINILRKYLISKVAWNDQLWSDCVERCSNETIFKMNIV